jgi:hypothetical protein
MYDMNVAKDRPHIHLELVVFSNIFENDAFSWLIMQHAHEP